MFLRPEVLWPPPGLQHVSCKSFFAYDSGTNPKKTQPKKMPEHHRIYALALNSSSFNNFTNFLIFTIFDTLRQAWMIKKNSVMKINHQFFVFFVGFFSFTFLMLTCLYEFRVDKKKSCKNVNFVERSKKVDLAKIIDISQIWCFKEVIVLNVISFKIFIITLQKL